MTSLSCLTYLELSHLIHNLLAKQKLFTPLFGSRQWTNTITSESSCKKLGECFGKLTRKNFTEISSEREASNSSSTPGGKIHLKSLWNNNIKRSICGEVAEGMKANSKSSLIAFCRKTTQNHTGRRSKSWYAPFSTTKLNITELPWLHCHFSLWQFQCLSQVF